MSRKPRLSRKTTVLIRVAILLVGMATGVVVGWCRAEISPVHPVANRIGSSLEGGLIGMAGAFAVVAALHLIWEILPQRQRDRIRTQKLKAGEEAEERRKQEVEGEHRRKQKQRAEARSSCEHSWHLEHQQDGDWSYSYYVCLKCDHTVGEDETRPAKGEAKK